jgi:tRNA(fMet)-specific endonuclease VapC
MRLMLDTNICIYLMRHQPPQVARRFAALQQGDAVMSAVTYAELRYGVELRPDLADAAETALAALVDLIPVLPFDATAARRYGELRAAVRDRQRNALDRLIAAHALANDLTLVTNNEADFRVYPGLRVENWI